MQIYIFLLIVSLFNINLSFSSQNGNDDYSVELTRFNRGFFTQVLSDPYCLQSQYELSEKLVSIRSFKDILKNFPDEPEINAFDASGMAPLHYLAITRIESNEDYDSIKEICDIFISLGANINLPNRYGISPLCLALNYGNYAIIDAFLATGKLRKDLNIFKTILSSELDSEWQIYRLNYLYGRIQICKALQKAWLQNIDPSDLEIIQLKFAEITTQLYDSQTNGYISLDSNEIINRNIAIVKNILLKSINNTENPRSITWDDL